jgi:hypothetical protein
MIRRAVLFLAWAWPSLACMAQRSEGRLRMWEDTTLAKPRIGYDSGYPLELMFSSAIDPDRPGELPGPLRFTGLGFEMATNYDFNRCFGSYFLVGYRHVGYIRDVAGTDTTYKYRTWNLSLGGGVKLGRMHYGLFFLGYLMELPFNYRERMFVGDKREDAFNEWFSKRTPRLSHAVMFGYQFPVGVSIKTLYYLNTMHRRSYDGGGTRPYGSRNEHVVSISVEITLFRGQGRYQEPILPEIIEM